MNKILASLLMIGLVLGVAGAGTWAYFSDTETSTGNTFTAGTLDLNLRDANDDGTDSETATLVFDNIAPGDWAADSAIGHSVDVVKAKNTGSIMGYLNIPSVEVINSEGANPESETNTADPGDLGANLNVRVFIDVNGNGYWNEGIDVPIYGFPNFASLDGFAAGAPYNINYVLNPTEDARIQVNWELKSSVGNDVQGDIATLNYQVSLSQDPK